MKIRLYVSIKLTGGQSTSTTYRIWMDTTFPERPKVGDLILFKNVFLSRGVVQSIEWVQNAVGGFGLAVTLKTSDEFNSQFETETSLEEKIEKLKTFMKVKGTNWTM